MKVWLSNTYDPRKRDAMMHIVVPHGQTLQDAWYFYQQWLKGKTIGKPKASKTYTVKQMTGMGMVGIYKEMTIWKAFLRLFKIYK